VQTETKIRWREAETDPPDQGVFVELGRPDRANEEEIKPLDRLYWFPQNWNLTGLHWRPVPAENFLSCAPTPTTERPPIDEDYWYVVLVEPNQELMTVWRLHEQGKELYIPSIRRRVKTGRTGKNGTKVTRVIPKPMFPGYGLIRCAGIKDKDINKLLKVRGVRQVLRDQGKPIVLPHEAVLAIFRKESQERHEFVALHAKGKKRAPFKGGDTVRVEAPGNVYDGLLATIEKDDGKDRIKVFLGMAKMRHELPADMVVAA
jgi:transcription antitermination factor NusG